MCRHMRLDRLFMSERSINKTRPLTALLQSSFLFSESRYQISLCVLFADSVFNTARNFSFVLYVILEIIRLIGTVFNDD